MLRNPTVSRIVPKPSPPKSSIRDTPFNVRPDSPQSDGNVTKEDVQRVSSSKRRTRGGGSSSSTTKPITPPPQEKPSFFSGEGQKQAGTRVVRQFEVIGKRTANVFLPKDREFQINTENASPIDRIASSPAFIFGAPAAVATSSALGVTSAVRGATNVITKPINKAFATNRLTNVLGVGAKTVAGVTTIKVGSDAVAQSRITPQQREALSNINTRSALSAGFQSQTQKAQEQGIFRNIGNELSIFLGDKSAFREGARKNLQEQGLQGQQLELATDALVSRRTSRGFGELGSQVLVAGASEKIGRFGISKAFEKGGQITSKKSFGEIAKRTVPSFGIAGFFEGFAGSQTQQSFREERKDFVQSIKSGGLGSLSAISLGTPIAGFALSRPGTSKGINLFANIIDPIEKPGDILANIDSSISRRFFGTPTTEPRFIPVEGSNNKVFRFVTETITPGNKKTPIIDSGLPDITLSASQQREQGLPVTTPPININTDNFVIAAKRSKRPGPTRTITPSINVPSIDTIIPPVGQFGGGKTNIINPGKRNPFIDPNTFTPVPANQQTPVSIPNINIAIGVPVTSFVAKSPPPFIPPFSLDTGGSGKSTKTKGSKFVNELELAFSLLGQQKTNQKTQMPKKSKKNKNQDPFELADQAFQNLAKSTAKKRRGFFI